MNYISIKLLRGGREGREERRGREEKREEKKTRPQRLKIMMASNPFLSKLRPYHVPSSRLRPKVQGTRTWPAFGQEPCLRWRSSAKATVDEARTSEPSWASQPACDCAGLRGEVGTGTCKGGGSSPGVKSGPC